MNIIAWRGSQGYHGATANTKRVIYAHLVPTLIRNERLRRVGSPATECDSRPGNITAQRTNSRCPLGKLINRKVESPIRIRLYIMQTISWGFDAILSVIALGLGINGTYLQNQLLKHIFLQFLVSKAMSLSKVSPANRLAASSEALFTLSIST